MMVLIFNSQFPLFTLKLAFDTNYRQTFAITFIALAKPNNKREKTKSNNVLCFRKMDLRLYILSLSLLELFSRCHSFNGELAEQECPDECDCHYFRINWVTDCSNSNLTQIPYEELSMNVYVLDLNDNLISDVQPFPADIKMRRLQMADNLMTELKRESFKGWLIFDCYFMILGYKSCYVF